MGMLRNRVSGRRTAVVLAVAGASLTGGIVSYSIAVASPTVSPEVRSIKAPEAPCEISGPDLDWYRQRGDQMQSGEMLPDTISFGGSGATLQRASTRPAGANPCGGGGGGGGGGGVSCLSTFGFDPTNYWAVLADTDPGASSANLYVAPVNNLTALTDNDIPTTTGCTVTYEWTFSEVDMPFADIIGFWNGDGASTSVSGATSTSMTVSGLAFGQEWSAGGLYNLNLCTGNLVLRVSDGVDDFDIAGPPCGIFRLETLTYSSGVGFKFDYKDPWNRDETHDQAPDFLGPGGGNFLSVAYFPTVKPNSPLTVTFKVSAPYTLKTGSDVSENCSDPIFTPVFSATIKNPNDTWVDPSPSTPRTYCLEELLA